MMESAGVIDGSLAAAAPSPAAAVHDHAKTVRAAATAAGFTGLFGYASTLVSGVGLGWMVQNHGWDAAFAGLLAMGACGTVCFLLAWPAKAHGYGEAK